MEEETQPNTLPRPPPPGRWARVRYKMGTVGLLSVVACFLAGIVLAASLDPNVRHGIGKVITHHGSHSTRSQLSTPSLRDGSPSVSPSSFTGGVTSSPPPRVSVTPVSVRPRVTPSAAPRPTTRSAPPVTPTVQPMPSSSPPSTTPVATPTTAPPPTPPVPTTPVATPTSASATVTTVPPVSSSSS